MATISIPDNFRATICDFTTDLSTTFPEYKYLWDKWANPETTEEDFQTLFAHCSKVYPERFFDILNQESSLFSSENTAITTFLPDVDFKMLYHCDGTTEKTRESIWKYLQVVLFLVVGTMKDKMDFGDAVNMFEDMNQDELNTKMEAAMENIGSFFQNMEEPKTEGTKEEDSTTDNKTFRDLKDQFSGINEHLRGMLDGKIGKLAQELAEDLGNDLAGTFGQDFGSATSTKDVLAKLMKNPQQITGLMKTVGDKLNAKMASGDISREELMSEAGDMMRKMKNMTGGDGGNMGDMFKNLAKGMNMNMPNPAAIAQMQKAMSPTVPTITAQQQKAEQMKREMDERQVAYDKFMAENPNIFNTDDPNSLVYRLEGEKQEKSSIHGPSSETVSASKKKRMKKKAKKMEATLEN